MDARLAVNLGFATNRYPEAEEYMRIVGEELGLRSGMFVADLLSMFYSDEVVDGEVARIKELAARYRVNLEWVFTAAFTPIPYKVITIAAGVCKINFVMFLAGSAVGRLMRFFIVATLIRIFGRRIREFIDKYFNILTLLFTILLIGGFAAIRYWDTIAAWVKSLF